VDRVIYVAMSGAKQVSLQQASVSHNLANVSTQGFKEELNVFRATPYIGDGAKTRAAVVQTTPRTDFTEGAFQQTGRDLDVAVRGPGWIAVQDAQGQEAYTRMGQLQVSPNGILQTSHGLTVLGDGGPIALPPDQEITVGKDGTVSAVPIGQNQNAVAVAGRIKLVNPEETNLVRGQDGLFRQKDGAIAEADAAVTLASGVLESSNVNPAEALVNMISLSRQFEMQMRVLKVAEENHRSADRVLSMR